jgi:pseudouridine-5'-phosphate glycosidase
VASSGIQLTHRVDDIDVLARVVDTRLRLGGGILVCTPVPASEAVDAAVMKRAIDRALAIAESRGIAGPSVTPLVLAEIAADTSGEAVRANLALAENNARLAGRIAVALATLSGGDDTADTNRYR